MTIKHPPDAIDGHPSDNSMVGKIHNLPPHLAILMMAAGWVRNDTRSSSRRGRDQDPPFDRRHTNDRRSMDS